MSTRPTLLFLSNCAWNLANFRRPVIKAFIDAGYKVVCGAAADGHEDTLRAMGAEFSDLPLNPGGKSPLADLRSLAVIRSILRKTRPTTVLTFTIKPNIYGLFAARLAGVPAIATISGLGSSYLGGGVTSIVTDRLYRLALRGAKVIFFQNTDDRDLFVAEGLAERDRAWLVAGSGIDLDRFRPAPPPPQGPFRFLLIARLLKDKGVVEYAEAARLLLNEGVEAKFLLLGPGGGTNPSAVPMDQIERWVSDGTIDYLGAADDVRAEITAAHCIVLPSYREGLPRSLLEGAAMARPLIAADVPGCGEVVTESVNGLLCAARSATDLARAMREMAALSPARRAEMGRAGRRMAETRFDERTVAAAYLEAVER